jgi:hypothetical protein
VLTKMKNPVSRDEVEGHFDDSRCLHPSE